MFKQTTFKQLDIARCSASCLGGNVAECIMFGESAGTNPGDVNLLNEIIGAVQPAMAPEATQSHIRYINFKFRVKCDLVRFIMQCRAYVIVIFNNTDRILSNRLLLF